MNEIAEFQLRFGSRYGTMPACPVVAFSSTESGSLGTISLAQAASWVYEVAKKLEALGKLQAGWDSYRGRPLKQSAKEFTVRAIELMGNEELPTPAVVLGSGGTIQLEWKNEGKVLDIDLGEGNEIEYAYSAPSGEIIDGQERFNIPMRLRRLASWLANV